jgi:excisionase family DNA binding protein
MPEKLYRSSEVAEILDISRALSYRLLANGTIPSIRFGRTVRCRPEDLQKFIEENSTAKKIDHSRLN